MTLGSATTPIVSLRPVQGDPLRLAAACSASLTAGQLPSRWASAGGGCDEGVDLLGRVEVEARRVVGLEQSRDLCDGVRHQVVVLDGMLEDGVQVI